MRPGAAIGQDHCDANNKKQWFRREPADPTATGDILISQVSGLCLDIEGSLASGAAKLLQWTCNRTPNQRFVVTKSPTNADPVAESTLKAFKASRIEYPDPEICWK